MKKVIKVVGSIILGLVLFASMSIVTLSSHIVYSNENPSMVEYSVQTSGFPFEQSEIIEKATTYEGKGIIWPAFIFNFILWMLVAFTIVEFSLRILKKRS